MEYHKKINLLDNTPNQLSKFRTKNWIEINDHLRGVYNTNRNIRFKTTLPKSSLWQYCKDEPNDSLIDFESFKSKTEITGNTPADGNTKDVKIIGPLKCLSNFWRTFEIPLISCQVNPILTWLSICVITNSTGAGRFAITDTKLYDPVVTLSTQDNAKLLQQLKTGFKRTINWNNHI